MPRVEVRKCPICNGPGWVHDYSAAPLVDGSAPKIECANCKGEGEFAFLV